MRIAITAVIFVLISSAISADVTVVVPVVPGANTQLLSLLETAMFTAGAEVESYLDDFGDKPLLFSTMTMSQAAGLPWGGRRGDVFQLGLGANAAAYLPSFNPQELEAIVDDFDYEDDIKAGAGMLPLYFRCMFPLNRFAPGLYGGLLVSAFDIRYDEYFYRGFSADAEIGWIPFSAYQYGQWVDWTALSLYSGLGFSTALLGAEVEPGLFDAQFDMDPDGPGPYPGETITVSADPQFDVGFRSWFFMLPLGAGTSVQLADTIGFALDMMSGFYIGASGLEISGGEDEVNVSGYLSGLISEPGSIMVDYSGAVMRAGFLIPRLIFTASFTVASLETRIPLGYGFDGTVNAGIEMEVLF